MRKVSEAKYKRLQVQLAAREDQLNRIWLRTDLLEKVLPVVHLIQIFDERSKILYGLDELETPSMNGNCLQFNLPRK